MKATLRPSARKRAFACSELSPVRGIDIANTPPKQIQPVSHWCTMASLGRAGERVTYPLRGVYQPCPLESNPPSVVPPYCSPFGWRWLFVSIVTQRRNVSLRIAAVHGDERSHSRRLDTRAKRLEVLHTRQSPHVTTWHKCVAECGARRDCSVAGWSQARSLWDTFPHTEQPRWRIVNADSMMPCTPNGHYSGIQNPVLARECGFKSLLRQ